MTTFSAKRRHCAAAAAAAWAHCPGDMTAFEHTHYFIKLIRFILTTSINNCLSNICKYIHDVLVVIFILLKFKSHSYRVRSFVRGGGGSAAASQQPPLPRPPRQ